MTDNKGSFNLSDLYPNYVITSKGEKKPFDETKIASVLNKETGLDYHIAEKVAEDVLRKIIGLGVDEIKTNHLRELVCVELTQRGMNKYRNLFARAINLEDISFKLDSTFVEQYKTKTPDWGPLGYFTYKRTYARIIEEENRKEEFWETLRRVIEGCYSIQKEHCKKLSLPWSEEKAQKSAQNMWNKIWNFKMTPPGRGFWMMGTEFINRHGSMALNNCGFASTADIDLKYSKAFEFVMDALMLGVGVGFDTKGAGKITIQKPQEGHFEYVIPDSREGWVDALKLILEAYFLGKQLPAYNYSEIRPAGAPIRGFGGIASGPKPLKEMLDDIQKLLEERIGEPIQSVDILDIMNYIGRCVVAGNVRRSAEIAIGEPKDLEFVTSKQDKEKLYSHRWASNNSVFAYKGLDYSFIADQIKINGEPGVFWLENARAYSRMKDSPDYKDKKVAGVNPCITGDTLIAVADGRHSVPIKVLAEEGRDIPVYCKNNTGRTVIRMMRNPRITGYNEEIYEVRLSDGSTIRCTGDHKFYLRNMEQKEARDLKSGDSLLITSKWQITCSEIVGEENKKKSTYWMIYDGKKTIFEHSLINEQLLGTKLREGEVLHYEEKKGLSNNQKNLEKTSSAEHDLLHDISGNNNPKRWRWNNATKKESTLYKSKLPKASSRSLNGNYSELTVQEIFAEMVTYIRKTQLPLTCTAWKKYSRGVNMSPTSSRWEKTQIPIELIKKANRKCGFHYYEDPAVMREYKRYIKIKKNTNLQILFDGCIYVIKRCEACGQRFKVKWGQRELAYCSYGCSNKLVVKEPGEKIKKFTKGSHKERHSHILEQILDLFEQYVHENDKIPTKLEYISLLNTNGISDLSAAGLPDSYQNFLNVITKRYKCKSITSRELGNELYNSEHASILKDMGLCYNHRVVSVKKVGRATVYNGTVDEFHNYGILLKQKKTKLNRPNQQMIFTANCGEQSLESFELCCLVETFPSRHDSYEEYQDTLKYAYLYAKSVTLVNTHWKETNAVMLKNRRMGISQTGIIEAFVKHGRHAMLEWCDQGYNYLRELDEEYSDWLCVPKSIKLTTVKPSGTVSILAGVPPGIHYPHSEYYIRRVRVSKNSDLITPLKEAGYHVEPDKYSNNSVVVEFPIHEENFDRGKDHVSIWEQAENAAAYQKYWSDNQVSITITFTPQEADEIEYVLECFEDKLKSVSFLPIKEHGYEQAPYEKITKEDYEKRITHLKPFNLHKTADKAIGEKFCDSDSCEYDYSK